MSDRTIKIPARFSHLADKLEQLISEAEKTAKAAEEGGVVDMAAIERQVESQTAAVEREVLRGVLQALDIDRAKVQIEGKPYSNVGRYEATYSTKAGPVTVKRTLYREDGQRNAKTVDTVSVRAGVVEDGWLPETAKAMAFYVQQGTSREAERAAEQAGRLPYSRSSFERVAHAVGALFVPRNTEIEDVLVKEFEVPAEAKSISAGLDRVSVPMEEPRPRPAGRPKKDAPKKPIARNFRMAYCGTVTLHDKDGKALQTLRYGRMPQGDAEGLCEGLAGDVLEILQKRPDLEVALLCDGAPEMGNRLDKQLNEDELGKPIHRLVDFYHVIEKLSPAAHVLGGDGAEALLRSWKMKLLNQSTAAREILKELRGSGRESVRVGETRPVHDAITYVDNNGDRMDYAAARRKGLPIGSGNTEATCKSLFNIRLKRSGSRWKETTGEHIVQLRALALSDRWDRAIELTLQPLRRAAA